MKRRKASDRMAECIIDMVHEYRETIENLNTRIDRLTGDVDYWMTKTHTAIDDCDKATDKLGDIADIIAEITEHAEDGYIKIYLSDVIPENAIKLKRLFKLLDIPMTADQIKVGDIDED